MVDIEWWSQPFPPEGGQTAEGIKKQLGRPKLDEYAVLVREAVQNSWDARVDDSISFHIDISRLKNRALQWRKLIGPKDQLDKGRSLLSKLHSDSVILTLSDRGTAGLGGPLRANEPETEGVTSNFVQFLRNVGEPRDNELGGGTYGFGKGIFYRISQAGTIIVDTKNTDNDSRSRRLMGASLGEVTHDSEGRRLTGRHWWGKINDGVPDPVLGSLAEDISSQLGLPGFEDNETGTDIVIVVPNLELDGLQGDLTEIGNRLRRYIYWYLWPKMSSPRRKMAINFSISVEGEELEFPELSRTPVLDKLSEALDGIHFLEGEPFVMKSHAKLGTLGRISLQHVIEAMLPTESDATISIMQDSPVQPPYRHVARMRQAELVVDYLQGDPMPVSEVGYVGTFVASRTTDDYFAQAEPPTHDAWETGTLTGPARGIVQRSKSFIRETCSKQVESRAGRRSKAVQGLSRLSTSLGSLIQGAPGNRAVVSSDRKPSSSGSANNSKGSSAKSWRILEHSHVVVRNGNPFVECSVEIDEKFSGGNLLAEPTVILARGKREKPDDAPAGSRKLSVIGWFSDEDPSIFIAGPRINAKSARPGVWRARMEPIDSVSVSLVPREENDR
ncbi:hypothetical protein [Corynebacterium variabile]|uniref:hypothetical protein n=1 Tax=Corynebacterium variabile TaxID=1727 RepID=UPI003FCFAADF